VEVVEETPAQLGEYARVSIGFSVTEVFEPSAIAALRRGEPAAATPLTPSYWKDYDAYEGNRPTDWTWRFERGRWTVLAAYRNGERVGGAVVSAYHEKIDLLRGRPDTALLWDLRVALDARHRGVGTMLLKSVEAVAVGYHARRLMVETQQVNVPACRFYQRNGFALTDVRPHAYRDLPDEVQLLWEKPLTPQL